MREPTTAIGRLLVGARSARHDPECPKNVSGADCRCHVRDEALAMEAEAHQQGAREERERVMAEHLRRTWHIENRPSGNCSFCKVIDPVGYSKAVAAALLAAPPAAEPRP